MVPVVRTRASTASRMYGDSISELPMRMTALVATGCVATAAAEAYRADTDTSQVALYILGFAIFGLFPGTDRLVGIDDVVKGFLV